VTGKLSYFFENKAFFYILVFVAMLITNFPFGFRYFLFSDDYNAYGVFSLFRGNIWQDVVLGFNIYGLRPLAGLMDAYIIAGFWGRLAYILLVFVIMRFVTILLLDAIFEKCGIVWGRVAVVFFAFFPTLTEATYWINASSRIVTSAFLGTLAAYAILKFIHNEERQKTWLAVALISGLLAQGFYEQGIIFTFVLTFGVLLIHRKAIENKIIFLWPFVNLLIIMAHYYIFRDVGHLGGRTQTTEHSIFYQTYIVATQVRLAFVHEQVHTVLNTFRWGLRFMVTEHLFLTSLVIVCSVLLALFVALDRKENKKEPRKGTAFSLVVAFVLFISTFIIFLFLDQAWIWVRNLFYSLIGLAIIIEVIVRTIRFNWHKVYGPITKGVVAFALIFIFMSSFILEVESLRRVERNDTLIVTNLMDTMADLEIANHETVWVFGLLIDYEPSISPRIASQVRLDWALQGHFEALYRSIDVPVFIPVMDGDAADIIDGDIFLGLDSDLNVRKLVYMDGDLYFVDTDSRFGTIEPGNGRMFYLQP